MEARGGEVLASVIQNVRKLALKDRSCGSYLQKLTVLLALACIEQHSVEGSD